MMLNESFNAPFALLAVCGLLLPALGMKLALWWFQFLSWKGGSHDPRTR